MDEFCVEFASVGEEICLRDRIGRYLVSNSCSNEVSNVVGAIFERLVLVGIRSVDQADVDLDRIRLGFVVRSQVGTERRDHVLKLLGEHGTFLVSL